MPRIVACMACFKIERIPDPPADVPLVPATVEWDDAGVTRSHTFTHDDGATIMVPEYDPLLEDVTGRHGHGRPDTEVMQFIKVFPCDQATFERLDVVTELKKELQQATGEFFEEVDHYRTEAVKCFNRHGNPEGGCIDYRDDSKKIGPTTPKPEHQTYLCYMCPVQHAYINVELRRKAGLYDPVIAQKHQLAKNRRMRRAMQRQRR